MQPSFTTIEDPDGVRISDPIENAQMDIYTEGGTGFEAVSSDRFRYPVDAAVGLTVEELRIPRLHTIFARNAAGELVAKTSNRESEHLDEDEYMLDVATGQLKLYLVVESELDITRPGVNTTISFPGPTEIQIGARSLHEHPATTITVGHDVEDVMQAVSLLGSAVKSHTPERSFPTLRGHPPLIQRGDAFEAPDDLEPPDTAFTLELPPAYEYVYPAVTLAFYLGATVVPADTPALVVEDDRYELPEGAPYADAIGRLLRRVFFLDCLVRTEGIYPIELHERRVFESQHPLDFAALYEAAPGERFAAYMAVPYSEIEPLLPTWKVTTDIEPTHDHVDVIPFVANDLSLVRCPRDDTEVVLEPEPEPLSDFYRTDGTGSQSADVHDVDFTQERIVYPEPVDSLEHAWVGQGFPLGASKVSVESYLRRLDHVAGRKPYISVDIVCNDPEMSQEDVVQEYYGLREYFQFEVDVTYEVTCDELADHLQRDTDFFHYIGHVDDNGFQCTDGILDARQLEHVEVEAFLLNACRSYEQGSALVERGSLGGIVTLEKVINEPAVKMGRALARALNAGFSLQSGLDVARHASMFGDQYISIGDGNLQLVKTENGTSFFGELVPGDDTATLDLRTYPSAAAGMGSIVTPHVKGNTESYINAGHIDRFDVTASELADFFDLGLVPLLIDGELRWSDEVDPNAVL